MATYTSTSGNYKTTLTVTETSTSIPNNTSTLSWSLKVERIGGASSQYGIYNGNQCPWSVSINGSRVGSGTFSYDFNWICVTKFIFATYYLIVFVYWTPLEIFMSCYIYV